MRTVNYRVWDKKLKYFDTSPIDRDVVVGGNGTIWEKFEDSFGGESFENYHQTDRYEIFWSTGLKDKNGVEIFEGDIFHLDDDMAPAVVEYTNEMDEQGSPASEYCLALYEHGKRFQRLSMGEFYINKCEVIGNIHENPELLQ